MGPGIFIKALLQGAFSLMVFGWAQIVMDIQPLVVMLTSEGHLQSCTARQHHACGYRTAVSLCKRQWPSAHDSLSALHKLCIYAGMTGAVLFFGITWARKPRQL
jgi:hypothetical protein